VATAEFQHLTEIAATVEEAWEALIQVEDWPSFTPTVSSVKRLDPGPLRVGSRARLRQPGLPPAVWTVTHVNPPSVFEWHAGPLTARHELEPQGEGCIQRLILVVDAPGVGLINRLARMVVNRTLAAENSGFKQKVEG
jgi:hypothetical protein